jgi:flagellar L-ring protein precursor FlgH
MSKAIVPLLVSGISMGVAGGAAMGQAVPPAQLAAASPGSVSLDHQSTQQLSTQYLMQNNGGSLLAAQSAQPAEPASSPSDPSKQNTSAYNLYAVAPPEAHVLKKHDLINIVVNEQSSSQTTGKSDQERASDLDAKVDAFVKFNLAKLSLQGGAAGANPPEVKLEASRDFKATGEYDRSDTMTTRLGAEIVDVKPNGTLVVEARRHLKIDEEEMTVVLTGECRVADVDASNAVLSTDLHDLNLVKTTKGEVRDTNKRGLIHRLLDIVSPF